MLAPGAGYILNPGRRLAAPEPVDRFEHGSEGGLGHLEAVEAALARVSHGKLAPGPDRAGIQLGDRLQHSHAPTLFPVEDRPVQRRGTSVARRARVHDQARMVAENGFGNASLQERGDHQVRAKERHGFLGGLVVDVELDGQLMPALGERHVQSLRQAVEAVGQEQDAHGQAVVRTGRR